MDHMISSNANFPTNYLNPLKTLDVLYNLHHHILLVILNPTIVLKLIILHHNITHHSIHQDYQSLIYQFSKFLQNESQLIRFILSDVLTKLLFLQVIGLVNKLQDFQPILNLLRLHYFHQPLRLQQRQHEIRLGIHSLQQTPFQ